MKSTEMRPQSEWSGWPSRANHPTFMGLDRWHMFLWKCFVSETVVILYARRSRSSILIVKVVVLSARNTSTIAVSLYCMWIFLYFPFFSFFRFVSFFFRSWAMDHISLGLLYGNPTLKVGKKSFKSQVVRQVIYKLFEGTSNIPSDFFTSYNCILLVVT